MFVKDNTKVVLHGNSTFRVIRLFLEYYGNYKLSKDQGSDIFRLYKVTLERKTKTTKTGRTEYYDEEKYTEVLKIDTCSFEEAGNKALLFIGASIYAN